jgi:hypothetical protein
MPSVAAVNALSADMQKLIDDFMKARSQWGFLAQALVNKKNP